MNYTKLLQLKAYDSMKDMLINGHFEKGKIYSETKTSKELGISRTPVRDAIQRLEQERYVDVIPSIGFKVHEMNEQDLLETYQIRCAIEGFCAIQLARNNNSSKSQKVIRSLENLIINQEKVLEKSGSVEEFAPYDQEFHEQIVAYSNNVSLINVFKNYLYQISSQMTLSLGVKGRMLQTVGEHRKILEAIKTGSLEKSYLAMLVHLEKPKLIIETMKECT